MYALADITNVINMIYNVAIYIRLSKEDEKIGESESITNQRSLLLRYIRENNYNLVDIYIDDGYSGTNFDRPEFKRMIADIESGKINMVITKDMSRLGRDYIGTGEFIEKYFPAHNVRYIALTDNIDTALDSTNNDIAPFKAIMNDYYAKDISKKIRTSLRTKQKDGKWVGGCPPFGYAIDPDDKNHLVPSEEEAPIVRKIFALANAGNSAYAIKEYLTQNKVPTSSMIRNRKAWKEGLSSEGIWSCKTVEGILKNQLYTGDLVQNRRSKLNYKIKKVRYNPKSEWIIVENTHEPLVDKETFNNIQKMLPKMSNRPEKEIVRLLDGLLYCYECGHRITICKPRKSDNKTYMACNYYRMNSKLGVCTSHGFNYDYIEEGIINILRELFKKTLDMNSIATNITPKCKKEDKREKLQKEKIKLENDKLKKQNNLDKMYIEKLEGKITEEMYNRISESLQEEIKKCEDQLINLNSMISRFDNHEFTSSECKKIITEFLNSETPTREMIIKLIDRVDVHENKVIDIYFNFKELNFLLPNSSS